MALLKFGVALHIYSPKIEMFGQIASQLDLPDCSVVVDLGNNFICDIKDVKTTVEKVCSYQTIDSCYLISCHF